MARQAYTGLEMALLRNNVRKGYTGPGTENQVVEGGDDDFYFPEFFFGRRVPALPPQNPPPLIPIPREQTESERELQEWLDQNPNALAPRPKPGFFDEVLGGLGGIAGSGPRVAWGGQSGRPGVLVPVYDGTDGSFHIKEIGGREETRWVAAGWGWSF